MESNTAALHNIMGDMVDTNQAAQAAPHESPLVPNRAMQRMYEGIVTSRELESFLRKRHKKATLADTRGQEACRVSALLDLAAEDLVSDLPGVASTALLLGAELSEVIDLVDDTRSRKKLGVARHSHAGLMPKINDLSERLYFALGAALALKRTSSPGVVVVFTEAGDVKQSLWKQVLHLAARQELAIFFVALPGPSGSGEKKHKKPVALSAYATVNGVPGIPVDASDAVALYRVTQESLGRARTGGGPALMECLHLPVVGHKTNARHFADPIDVMARTLLDRQICGNEWMSEVASTFEARLDAVSPAELAL